MALTSTTSSKLYTQINLYFLVKCTVTVQAYTRKHQKQISMWFTIKLNSMTFLVHTCDGPMLFFSVLLELSPIDSLWRLTPALVVVTVLLLLAWLLATTTDCSASSWTWIWVVSVVDICSTIGKTNATACCPCCCCSCEEPPEICCTSMSSDSVSTSCNRHG